MNNNKFGIASLVVGGLSFVTLFIAGPLLGIIGLALGVVALAYKERTKGLAIGGIVVSFVGIIVGTVVLSVNIIHMADGYLADRSGERVQADADDEDDSKKRKEDEDDISISEKWDRNETDKEDSSASEKRDRDETDEEDKKREPDTEVENFAGKQFKGSDGSVIYFETDDEFVWYQSDEDHDDNYFSGTYEFYFAEDAQDYIVNDLSDLGVTKNELTEYFERNNDSDFYKLSNFCCMVMHNDKMKMNGEDIDLSSESSDSYYMGFYADGYLDAANMLTGNYASFTLK